MVPTCGLFDEYAKRETVGILTMEAMPLSRNMDLNGRVKSGSEHGGVRLSRPRSARTVIWFAVR